LPPIGCVVVLMLENRSFDHLFGKSPGVAGVAQGSFSNRPAPQKAPGPTNSPIAAGQPAQFS
jgi:phospholipase C